MEFLCAWETFLLNFHIWKLLLLDSEFKIIFSQI